MNLIVKWLTKGNLEEWLLGIRYALVFDKKLVLTVTHPIF